MEKFRNNYIVQAWLVLFLALCFGSSLAAIQLSLSPKIELNKINETREQVPELVLGVENAAALEKAGNPLVIDSQTISVEKNNKHIMYKVFQALDNGKSVGWVVKSGGQGYADKIELLIGFSPRMDIITGLFILEQKETPGLGNKIMDWNWRKQFIDKSIDRPLVVVKTGSTEPYEIDSITGATISSRSVCTIVNSAISDLREPLSNTDKE